MPWFGLGKPRSRLGKWIDDHGISQAELEKKSGVSRDVIRILAKENKRPSWRTEKRLMQALRQYDSEISAEDFWG